MYQPGEETMFIHAQAKRLQTLRLKHNLTTRELGKNLGVSGSVVSRWCLGKAYPSRKHTKRICEYFKIEPAWFIYGVDNPVDEQLINITKLTIENKITFLQTYQALLEGQKVDSRKDKCTNED
jgi:transcriptional regulator with XRE-family HTH domain